MGTTLANMVYSCAGFSQSKENQSSQSMKTRITKGIDDTGMIPSNLNTGPPVTKRPNSKSTSCLTVQRLSKLIRGLNNFAYKIFDLVL